MASLTEIYSAMVAATQALSNLTLQLTSSRGTFITALNGLNASIGALPHTSAVSTVIPSSVGALSFPSSQPSEFLIVATSTGGTVKIPAYPL